MKIICEREIKTTCYEVLMDIGTEEERPDIISVLKLAQDRRGSVSPKDICDHLLGGRPETVGEQIIIRLQDYGFLEGFGEEYGSGNRANLTDLGREIIDEDRVMLPQRALYQIWVTGDPILPNGLVSIKRLEGSNLKDDVDMFGNLEEENDSDNLLSLEDILFIEGKKHKILVENDEFSAGSNVQIFKLEELGKVIGEGNIKPSAIMTVNEDGSSALKIGETKNRITIDSPKISFSHLLEKVAESIDSTWDEGFIDANLESLPTHARREFMIKTLSVKEVQIWSDEDEDLGYFSVTAQTIPVDTTDEITAEEWANWLLRDSINEYITPGDYLKIVNDIIYRFQRVEEIELPTQEELAEDIKREGTKEQYWYLQATLDLNPEGAVH